ncbi:hypothetical protein E8E11_001276 [Didymella keratinophila]|nr:hypothetical protein E8E11_001276 [Didymella keratinophila]
MAPNYPPRAYGYTTTQQSASPLAVVDVNAQYAFDHNGRPQLAWPNDLDGAFVHLNFAALQDRYIGDVIVAVYNTTNICDNPDYTGIRNFTLGHDNKVSCFDVEAACSALFATILDHCTNGHRGLTDRLNGSEVEAADRDGTCQIRVDNVLRSLREWKSVCKDILRCPSKIANLANAPATAWQDKLTQKNNNRTKKNNTQKDRETGRKKNAQQQTGQQKKQRGQGKKAKAVVQSPAASSSEHESQMHTSSAVSQFPFVKSTAAKLMLSSRVLENIGKQKIDDFDTWSDPYRTFYSTADVGGLPQDPPAYDAPDFGGLPQQSQQSMNPYVKPSALPSHQFLPQQASAQPTYGGYGSGMGQSPSLGQNPYPQGLSPRKVRFRGFNYLNNPYDNFAPPPAVGYGSGYGPIPNSSSTSATYGDGLMNEITHVAGTKMFFHRLLFQSEPTRVKRGESHNDAGLNQVDEE